MFKWKISSENCLQCPPIQHAVGVWRDKKDFIFACSDEWIFAIRAENNKLVLLENRKNFLSHEYPGWHDLIPRLQRNVLASDYFLQLCISNNGEYYLISRDPKLLFTPKSCAYKIDGLLAATFIHVADGTRIILLFANMIVISKHADWWEKEGLSSVCDIENNGQFTRLISNLRRFIVYGENGAAAYNKKGTLLWSHTFEQKILLIWHFESGFQIAILFQSGEMLLFDDETGKLLMEKPMEPISIYQTAHVVVKNSPKSGGNAFYLVSQQAPAEDGQCQTMIREISALRTEVDFTLPQRQIKTTA